MMIMSVMASAVMTRAWPLSSDAARRILPPGPVSPQSRLAEVTDALNGTDRGDCHPSNQGRSDISPVWGVNLATRLGSRDGV